MAKTYPAVLFMAGHGRRVALGAGVLVALGATAALATGGGIAPAVAGYVAAGIVWGVMRLGAEIVEVVAETLLPR